MLDEVLSYVTGKNYSLIVDGTLGLGGYTEAFLNIDQRNCKVLAFDLDQQNMQLAKKRLEAYQNRVFYHHGNYAELAEGLAELGVEKCDAFVLDLGISSTQVDEAERGFSFLRNGPLDMRFDKNQPITAADLVNNASEKELLKIFRDYGEEPKAYRYVQTILTYRRTKKITETVQLAELISAASGMKFAKVHPATKVFQALRMAVNQELANLERALETALRHLSVGGRIIVVTFHSLEDRLVKQFFKENAREYVNLPGDVRTTILKPSLKILTKKPLVPSEDEVAQNRRSRSAKLRVAEKI